MGLVFLGLGGFAGVLAMMFCLFKCLWNYWHCNDYYQDDAEEARVRYTSEYPEEVTVKTSRQPPPYSSLFGVKQESNYEDTPPPYPGTH